MKTLKAKKVKVDIPKNVLDLLCHMIKTDPCFAEMVRQRAEQISPGAVSILEAPVGSFPTQPPVSQEPSDRPSA